jgi:CHAT domain-containing protein/Tfp pilus assembly protein PilF
VLLLVFRAFGQQASSLSPTTSREGQGETQAAADSFYSSARSALQQGDLDGAEKYFRQSLSTSEKLVPGSLSVARSLNGLGDVAQQRGMPPEAKDYYQQALAIVEKLDSSGAEAANSLEGLARAAYDLDDFAKFGEYALQAFSIREKLDSNSLDFALGLNSIAGVYMYRKQWDKAEEAYKKALSIEERLAPESLVLAETLRNLGRLFHSRQRYEEAKPYHLRALAIRRKVAPDSLAVAESLRSLGVCARDDLDQQERYYRAALAIQEKLAPGSFHVAFTLSFLSDLEQIRGDMIASEADGRQALAIWERMVPGSVRSRRRMIQLANVLIGLGDLAEAEEFAQRATEEDRKEDPVGAFVGWDLSTLAKIASDRGDLVAADDYYRRALEIAERVDPGGRMPARMMRGLGGIAETRGDLPTAEDYYRRALAIWEKTDPDGNNFAQGLFSVGMIIHDRGDLAEAERYYRRALVIWEKILPDTIYIAQLLGRLGRLARDQGDLQRAEQYQRRAIAIEQKSVPGGYDLAKGFADLGDILLAKGELSEALGYHQQALLVREKLWPGTFSHAASLAAIAEIMRRQGKSEVAAQYYQKALDALENQTARLGGGDELRAGFRARRASYYKDYIGLLAGQKRFDLAFQVLERFRARSLLETLAVARAEIRKGADPALLEQQRGLQQSLAAKTQRRIQLLGAKGHDAELGVLDKEIQDLHAQCQEVEDRIRAGSPSYAALMHPQPISAKEAQEELLDDDTVLLEYSLGEERSYVWVLTRGSLAAYELPKRLVIEEAAREIYTLLNARSEIHLQESAAQKQARLERAQQQYQEKVVILTHMVLEPVAKEIENKKRLLIVSDGALQYVPFSALPIPGTETAAKVAVPLLITHEIVNLPSASSLAALRQQAEHRQPAPRAVAVLADPVFTSTDSRVRVNGAAGSGIDAATMRPGAASERKDDGLPTDFAPAPLTRSAVDVGLSGSGRLQLPRLPFSRREADAIMAVIPEGSGLKAVDFDASRAMAMSPDLAQYRIVHFATHGLLDSQHPELSGLVLSLVNKQGRAQDGFLELQDIYNLNLAADLVVLSACETGLGKEVNGEGLIGLTRGFMYAGATRVVSSLWNVDDFATAKLMKAFYTSMEHDGKRPAAALREAQLSMFRDRRWSLPYYWAGFTIQGEWK